MVRQFVTFPTASFMDKVRAARKFALPIESFPRMLHGYAAMVFWQSHFDHVPLAVAHDFLLHVVQTIQAGKQACSNYARALHLRFTNAMSEVRGITQFFSFVSRLTEAAMRV